MAIYGSGSAGNYLSRPWNGGPIGNTWTLSLWVKAAVWNTAAPYNSLLYLEGPGSGVAFGLGEYTGTLYCDLGNSTTINTSVVGLSAGVFHHILTVNRGSAVELWIDGAKTGATGSNSSTPFTPANVYPGAHVNSSNNFATPTTTAIAECAFWNGQALGVSEIVSLYRGSNPLFLRRPTFYFPLRGAMNWADAGTQQRGVAPSTAYVPVASDHPSVALPPRRKLFKAASVAVAARRPRVFIAA